MHEDDILPTDQTVPQEKVELDLEDEKVLAGRYDSFLKSHSVSDEMYVNTNTQVAPHPVDLATQNVSELFTQLQQANAKVTELEKQVLSFTHVFRASLFLTRVILLLRSSVFIKITRVQDDLSKCQNVK